MGQAGLAVIDDPAKTAFVNPAALVYKKSYFRWPSLDYHIRGTGLGEVIGKLSEQSNLSASEAVDLVRDFAARETEMALTADLAFKTGPVEVAVRGMGNALVQPNSALQNWANTGGGTLPADGEATVTGGAIYSLPSVAWAGKWETKNEKTKEVTGMLALGVRAHFLHSVYRQERVTVNDTTLQLEPATLADTSDNDWSLDAGVIFTPAQSPDTTVALVATNLKPAKMANLKQETVVDVGASHKLGPFLFAADWRNLTSAYGVPTQFNAGVEFVPSKKLKRLLALRTGFSSRGVGTSFGVSLFGIDLALMGKRTFDAATTLHF